MTDSKISVVVPTYRRPESLRRCLVSLLEQRVAAAEVIVGRRANDLASAAVVASLTGQSGGVLREAVVDEHANLVQSMNAALAMTTGDLVALTDDDAEAPPEWLGELRSRFTTEGIGAAGGRDWQPRQRWNKPEVGVVRWWGGVVGNHHLGSGPARDVDVLKGVNCCFRGDLLRSIGFERRLRGRGNVSHWELHLCFAVQRRGLRLLYDPAVAVDHHIEQRVDGDVNARGGFEPRSFIDEVHNAHLAMLEHLPALRRVVYRVWRAAIGTAATPGALQVLRRIVCGDPLPLAMQRYRAARKGCWEGEKTWRATKSQSACGTDSMPGPLTTAMR